MAHIFDEIQRLRDCAADALIGECLGSGATRRVFALRHNPDLVIKIEFASKRFCNVAEYDMWFAVKGTKFERYFAPVVSIEPWAGALIMKRTKPLTEEEFDAEVRRLPSFMADTHWANFGRLDGRIVCHDYGFHRAFTNVINEAKVIPLKQLRKTTAAPQ